MNLPELLLSDNPLRPWAFAVLASLIACLPQSSRRVGGILLFVVAISFAASFCINHIIASFSPTG